SILSALGDGLFISDLHYLNWSDRESARVTGLTRYACFEVASGKLLGPVGGLRFDDSLYRLFGSELVDLTDSIEFIPDLNTYDSRSPGGARLPGVLVSALTIVG